MVKKLIKHELYAYFRSVWPVTIVVLGLTVLSWIMSFAQNSLLYWMLSLIMLVVLIYGVIAMLLGPIAKRFRKTMFSGEGYMTFSIPATPVQLIVAKLVSAMILWIYTLLLFFVFSLLFSLSLRSFDIENSLSQWSTFFNEFFHDIAKDPLLFAEQLVLALVASVSGILFIFTGICVGQLSKSRKSMVTVLFYVVIFFIVLFLQPFLSDLYTWLYQLNQYVSTLLSILFFAAIAAVCFLSTKYIVTHKLNLVA